MAFQQTVIRKYDSAKVKNSSNILIEFLSESDGFENFQGSIGFSDKILTRKLMNSAHKISRPKGKYVKTISKVR